MGAQKALEEKKHADQRFAVPALCGGVWEYLKLPVVHLWKQNRL